MPSRTATSTQHGTDTGTAIPITAALVGTLALQSAVPPFATDMYTPAFPQVTASLDTQAALVGLTLTAFFAGMGVGQLLGGPISDQRGRRIPMITGGLICALGAVGCALAPNVWFLIVARVVQGLGGGVASAVGRAVVVDIAKGDQLARLMSVLMSLGGLAPMIAPVLGAAVVSVGTWRTVFWTLVGLGLLMALTGALLVPESLPPERRHAGGLRSFGSGLVQVIRIRAFVGYMLTSAFSGFAMMAYVSDAAYVLEAIKGLKPMPYSLFFASAALAQILVSLLNARLVGRFTPRQMIRTGLTGATIAVSALAIGVLFFGTPLILTCACFMLLMAMQGFVFGNSSALASAQARHVAGAASAVLGIAGAIGGAVAAPLASSGGDQTALPMVLVMIFGLTCSLLCYFFLAPDTRRMRTGSHPEPSC